MIRMLLVLVVVGLALALVARTLEQVPTEVDSTAGAAQGVELRNAVHEAEQVKALLEQQQQTLQRNAESYRNE